MADTYDPESSNNEEDKDLQQTVADTPETAFKIYYDALYEEANFVRAHPMRKVVHRYWVCTACSEKTVVHRKRARYEAQDWCCNCDHKRIEEEKRLALGAYVKLVEGKHGRPTNASRQGL